ncbi:spermatogenesis-associated protein 22 [Xyrauchen texanus]|uniref:spermatogenesis-associated protein 22 n=1 Tax=Xyrauchen texanus TaxID=154827 RepID=UPI0022427165|nr:spermatogenesis-associated protein 22 [Xyrauchen texanus]
MLLELAIKAEFCLSVGCLSVPLFNQRKRSRLPLTSNPSENQSGLWNQRTCLSSQQANMRPAASEGRGYAPLPHPKKPAYSWSQTGQQRPPMRHDSMPTVGSHVHGGFPSSSSTSLGKPRWSSGFQNQIQQSFIKPTNSPRMPYHPQQCSPAAVCTGGPYLPQQCSPAAVSTGGPYLPQQCSLATVSTGGPYRPQQCSPAAVSTGGPYRPQQCSPAAVSTGGPYHPQQCSPAAVSTGGPYRPQQCSPAAVSTVGPGAQSQSTKWNFRCAGQSGSGMRAKENTSSERIPTQQQPQRETSMRILTAVIEGMKHWSKYKNKVPIIFEIFATLDSAVTVGEHGAKTFSMRDGKHVIQCLYYENVQALPRLIRGQVHRCVGNYDRDKDTMTCVSVRAASLSEQRNAQEAVKASDVEMRNAVLMFTEI